MKKELIQMVRCRFSRIVALLCLSMTGIAVNAQDANVGALPKGTEIQSASFFGIGGHDVQDTYLSPNMYSGQALVVASEKTTLMSGKGRRSYLNKWTKADVGMLSDNALRGAEISFHADMLESRMWMFYDDARFTVLAGYNMNFLVGGVYNLRNSNNPAQAKVYVGAGLSTMGIWRFQYGYVPFAVRLSLDMPLLGLGFSPEYGQLYYQIYENGLTDHNIFLSHPFNSDNFSGRLMIDIPAGNVQLRTGVELRGYSYKVNNLKSHQIESNLMLGIVKKLEYGYNGRNR